MLRFLSSASGRRFRFPFPFLVTNLLFVFSSMCQLTGVGHGHGRTWPTMADRGRPWLVHSRPSWGASGRQLESESKLPVSSWRSLASVGIRFWPAMAGHGCPCVRQTETGCQRSPRVASGNRDVCFQFQVAKHFGSHGRICTRATTRGRRGGRPSDTNPPLLLH